MTVGSIASLGIEVNSGDAVQAATDLDKLAAAGGRAGQAADKVASSAKKAGAAIKDQKDELALLLGEIDPTVKALGRLDDLEQRLAKQKNFLDADTFNDYQAKIARSRAELGRLNDVMGTTGISAKQTAAALRGVPAQLTDIVVSLQGGQAPLTVLLQQGGQLKDMFGGIGPAAKALGGYVAGLVNPFTVAAAAAGALALTYYKGSKEADAYRQSLVLSGNAAGTSADSLASLAKQISASVGTTGAAADVLAKLAGNGRIASTSFEEITKAALAMQQATGQAIDETVADFAKIAKDPVAAAKELNERYNFLTAAVYSQIVALEKQNDTTGAAKVLTDAYAGAVESRSKQILVNLGTVERAWLAIKNAAKEAVDATLDVGRTRSIDEQIANYQSILDDRKTSVAGKLFPDTLGANSDSTKFIEAQIAALKRRRAEIEADAKAQADSVKTQNDAMDAQRRVDAVITASLSPAEKRNKLLKEYREDIERIRKANPNDARVTPEAVARGVKDIEDKNKDPKSSSGAVDLTSFNDQQNALKALVSDYANSQKELDAQQKAGLVSAEAYYTQRTALIRAEKDQVTSAYQAEIDALEQVKGRSSTTAAQRIQLDQKIADARASMVKAQKDADSELKVLADQEQGRLTKQTLAVKTYTDALQQQVATLREQGARAASSLGMGDRQRSLYDSQNAIEDRINQQKLDLANQYGDGSRGMSLDEYQQKLAALNKTQQDLRDTVLSNYNDMTAAQGDWAAGASSAWANYQENALNVAGQTKTAFTSLFDGLTDSMVDWAFGADESFGDVAVSFAKMLAKMAAQAAASSVFSSIAGSLFGSTGSAGAAAGSSAGSATSSALASIYSNGLSGGGYTGDGGKYDPKGIVHGGEVVIRKEVVSQPGMKDYLLGINARGYADGGYVGSTTAPMVSRQSSGGSTIGKLEININRDGTSSVDTDTEMGKGLGDDILKLIDSRIKQNEAKSLSSQGSIRKAINGRG